MKLPYGGLIHLAEPDHKALTETQKVGCQLISGGKIFQRAGAMVEKVLLLDTASQNSLTGSALCPLCWCRLWGGSPIGQTVPQVTWICAMQGFIGNNQHIQLQLEAHWQPVHLMEQWCNMGHSRDPKYCPRHHLCASYSFWTLFKHSPRYIWSLLMQWWSLYHCTSLKMEEGYFFLHFSTLCRRIKRVSKKSHIKMSQLRQPPPYCRFYPGFRAIGRC